MAGAFTALAEGPQAGYWNPGALGLSQNVLELSVSGWSLLPGHPRGDVSWPLRFADASWQGNGLGLAGHFLYMSEDYSADVYSPGGAPGGASFRLRELVASMAGGIDLRRWTESLPEQLSIGIGAGGTFYRSKQEVSGLGPFDEEVSGTALDMDLGTLLRWHSSSPLRLGSSGLFDIHPVLSGGFVVLNLFDNRIDLDSSELILQRSDRAGVALSLATLNHERWGSLLELRAVLERRGLLILPDEEDDAQDQVGAELVLAQILSFRKGRLWDPREGQYQNSWGIGVGLQPGNPYSGRFGGSLEYAFWDPRPHRWLGLDDHEAWSFSFWMRP